MVFSPVLIDFSACSFSDISSYSFDPIKVVISGKYKNLNKITKI